MWFASLVVFHAQKYLAKIMIGETDGAILIYDDFFGANVM